MNEEEKVMEAVKDFQPVAIPQPQIDFCVAVAKLAKEHGCSEFTLDFRVSGFYTDVPRWMNGVKAFWRRDRHSEPAKLHASSTADFHVDI